MLRFCRSQYLSGRPSAAFLTIFPTSPLGQEGCNFDKAINRLVAANKRVCDASDAMGDPVHVDQLGAPFGTVGDCFSTKKTRWPLFSMKNQSEAPKTRGESSKESLPIYPHHNSLLRVAMRRMLPLRLQPAQWSLSTNM